MKSKFQVVLMALCLFPALSQAQDLKSVLSNVLGGSSTSTTSSTVSTATDLLGSLLGTSTVSQSSLVGTWTYTQPAIAFESENLLNKIGGTVAANTIETKIATQLSEYGIKAGSMVFTFAKDNTFTCKIGTRNVSGTYAVSGATVSFTFLKVKALTANVKLSGSNMQLTFTADKLLTFLQGLNSLGTTNSTLTTVATLLKTYKGMQLGLQFKK